MSQRRTGMSDRPSILVTGGAGYIGSHCCRAPLKTVEPVGAGKSLSPAA